MRNRPGITLIEVLAAIFIMGIGMMAILTLFPLGALSMARAVREDRAAAMGANGLAVAASLDLGNDTTVKNSLDTTPSFPGTPPTPCPAPDPTTSSYPVYVDPYYFGLSAGDLGPRPTFTGAPDKTPGLKRCGVSFATTLALLNRWFSLQDEIEFDNLGQPRDTSTGAGYRAGGGGISRPGTYTLAFLVRRPQHGNPAPPAGSPAVLTPVDVSVVVYANRSLEAPGGERAIPGQTGETASGTKGATTIDITYVGDRPKVRRGTFVLDTSYRTIAATGLATGTVNADFYRVANVTDTGSSTLTLELETELKENVTTLVVMENVVAVLDRGVPWTFQP